MTGPTREPARPRIQEFLGEPTRDLEDWRWLWSGDHTFPISSRPSLLGRLIIAVKRLLRPFVRYPVGDLWERQRVFDLITIEKLIKLDEIGADLMARARAHEERLGSLEASRRELLETILRHNDALFARVDQKLDRYRGEARRLWSHLGSALAELEGSDPAPLARARRETTYLELEHFHRGTEEEIGDRLAAYGRYLEGRRAVVDLGCGRGEALELLRERGIPARGFDASARMVAICREKGLAVEEGDLFAALEGMEEGTTDAILSFHVIEHLPPEELDRLARLAWQALEPGGVLILETPSPLSLMVAARNFWIDPTHRRPVHPESLKLMVELAGFEQVERIDLHPFADEDRLSSIEVRDLPEEQHALAYQINRLRDELDDLLFGYQDYAIVGFKP